MRIGNNRGSPVDAEAAQRAAEEAAKRAAEEAARRAAEEAARKAAEEAAKKAAEEAARKADGFQAGPRPSKNHQAIRSSKDALPAQVQAQPAQVSTLEKPVGVSPSMLAKLSAAQDAMVQSKLTTAASMGGARAEFEVQNLARSMDRLGGSAMEAALGRSPASFVSQGIHELMPKLMGSVKDLASMASAAKSSGDLSASVASFREKAFALQDLTATAGDSLRAAIASQSEAATGAQEDVLTGLESVHTDSLNATTALEVAEGQAALAETAADQTLEAAEGGAVSGFPPLSEAELGLVGQGLGPDGGPSAPWNHEGALGTYNQRAKEQGLIPPEVTAAHQDLVNKLIGTEKPTLEATDLASAAKAAGIPLEKLDPNQLLEAARYVNGATDVQNARDRLAMSLDNLHVTANGEAPHFERKEMTEILWAQAKIPGHALTGLSDAQLAQKFEEVNRASNTPGDHALKVGSHDVKLSVSADGALASSSTKKPSFLSKLGKIASVGLKIASFIPGPVGAIAKGVQVVVNVVKAVKSGNIFGAITGAASALLGGAASKIVGIANNVKAGVQAFKAKNPIGFLSAVAGAAGSIASGIGNAASGLAKTMNNISTWAGRGANGIAVVNQAKKGDILGAVSSGAALAGSIAKADSTLQKDLNKVSVAAQGAQNVEANLKNHNFLGAIAAGASAGSSLAGKDSTLQKDLSKLAGAATTAGVVQQGIKTGDYLGAASAATQFASTLTNNDKLKEQLTTASTALTQADTTLAAIKKNDWLAAVSSGAAMADTLSKNKDVEGLAKVSGAVTTMRDAVKSGNPDVLLAAGKNLADVMKEAGQGVYDRHLKKPLEQQVKTEQNMAEPATAKLSTAQIGGAAAQKSTSGGDSSGQGSSDSSTMPISTARAASGTASTPSSTDVRIAQDLLNQRLGTTLAVDGKFGPETKKAVSQFQQKMQLPVTGDYDAKTQELLETQAPFPTTSSGAASATTDKSTATSTDIKIAQDLLNQRLGTTLQVDGRFGPETQKAVSQFQQKMQLPVTGTYDQKTQDLLETGAPFPPPKSTVALLDSKAAASIEAAYPNLAADAKSKADLAKVFDLSTPGSTADAALALTRLAAQAKATPKEFLDKVGMPYPKALDPLLGDSDFFKNAGTALDTSKPAGERVAAMVPMLDKLAKSVTSKERLENTVFLSDNFGKLAPTAGAIATAIADPNPANGLKNAMGVLASLDQDGVKGDDAKEVCRKLSGMGSIVSNAIGTAQTFLDPKATTIDKLKAAAALAKSTPDALARVVNDPTLQRRLGAMAPGWAIVNSTITICDPKASVTDKTIAAATVLANAKEAGTQLVELKNYVRSAIPGVNDAAIESAADYLKTVGKGGTAAAEGLLRKGITEGLQASEKTALEAMLKNKETAELAQKLLPNLSSASQVSQLLKQTEKLSPETLKSTLSALSEMRPEVVQKFIGSTIEGKESITVLSEVLGKVVSTESRAGTAKLISKLGTEEAGAFLKMANNLSPELLAMSAKTLGTVDAGLLGKAVLAADKMVTKIGVKWGAETAARVLGSIGKAIPAIGAAVAGKAIYDNAAIALDSSLPPEIRFMAVANAKLNAADATLGVLEAVGVGNVAFPANVALALGELGLDLKLMAETDKFRKSPGTWKSTPAMDAIVGAAALDPVLFPLLAKSVSKERLAEIYKNTASYPFVTVGNAVAKTYGEVRAGVGAGAAGGTVAQLKSRVAANAPSDFDDADELHRKNDYFREQFLRGGFANLGFTEDWQKKLRTDPEAIRLLQDTRYSPHNAAKERDLAMRLQRLANEFLKENEKKLQGL